ncbi:MULTISPECIES: hypothetical protein [Vibrio]|uniref:hypothetical protein n=1 Tax=Vibrio TaxID=662 RepID=UPI000B5C3F51|nr:MULTISPECIES: hypothetical protein [Vibrio]HBV77630.1 hypothetical protein [Vibrio sp.]
MTHKLHHKSKHSYEDIKKEIFFAEVLIEQSGTEFPDSTFEEGYIAALQWILNESGSNVREEFLDLCKEKPEILKDIEE